MRAKKKASQREIEKRAHLLQCHLSRIENGHTVPSLETLEKIASALEVPTHYFFYDGKTQGVSFGSGQKDARWLANLVKFLGQITDRDRKLIMATVREMVRTKPKKV